MVISFFVPGLPIAQPRPRARATVINGRAIATVYHPKKHPVSAYRQAVALKAKEAYRGEPLQGPLRVELVFLFPRPSRLVWKTLPMPRLWHTQRPDAENLAKGFLDSAGLWGDDSQVAELLIRKFFAAGGEAIGTEATITNLSMEQLVALFGAPDTEDSNDLANTRPTG